MNRKAVFYIDPVYYAATEWAAARRAFLALPSNHPNAKQALARLANAENALMRAVEA